MRLKRVFSLAMIMMILLMGMSIPGSSADEMQRSIGLITHRSTQSIDQQKTGLQSAFAHMPIRFEQNRGKYDQTVQYVSRSQGLALALKQNEVIMALPTDNSYDLLTMKFLNANRNTAIIGQTELPTKTNYYRGKDVKDWQSNISNYAQVRYQQLYPGIDLLFYGNGEKLEYDLILSAGANVDQIRIEFDGVNKIEIAENGDLILRCKNGEIRQHRPFIYQVNNGVKESVDGRYYLKADNQIGFQLAYYDKHRPLTIDPIITYATYLGGKNEENISDIAIDDQGNCYISGRTYSIDFPTYDLYPDGEVFGYQAFVAKLNHNGTALEYLTFIDGRYYSQTGPGKIAVDSVGNAYIAGGTNSTTLPILNAIQTELNGINDGYIVKLDNTGKLIYGTYLGGSKMDGCSNIAVNNRGDIYLAGTTNSTDFPLANAAFNQLNLDINSQPGGDMFVAHIDASGSALIYSSYLGGSGGESASAIVLDAADNLYLCGRVSSKDFPTSANAFQPNHGGGSYDGFVAKINPIGALAYASYLGGSQGILDYTAGNEEECTGIVVDDQGNAYVTGYTPAIDFPITNKIHDNNFARSKDDLTEAFVAKISPDGSRLIYSSYLGGERYDFGQSIVLKSNGQVIISGSTTSGDFPLLDPLQHNSRYGDIFITEISSAGDRITMSTMLGSYGGNIKSRLDNKGNLYLAGGTGSPGFPVVSTAMQPIFNNAYGNGDLFIAKLELKEIRLSITAPVGGETLIAGQPAVLSFADDPNNSIEFGGFSLWYSTDDGKTYANNIGHYDGRTRQIIWNVPDNLATDQCRIMIMPRTVNGGKSSLAVSNSFKVVKPKTNSFILQEEIMFYSPKVNEIAAPQNPSLKITKITPNLASPDSLADARLIGYNIYRTPRLTEQLPDVAEIVKPENLVGAIPAVNVYYTNQFIFNDQVSTLRGSNFAYSVVSCYNDGRFSVGSQPVATKKPVIKKPQYRNGVFYLDAKDSFITTGAVLNVNGYSYPLIYKDKTGTFRTRKNARTSAGLLKHIMRQNETVTLSITDPVNGGSLGYRYSQL